MKGATWRRIVQHIKIFRGLEADLPRLEAEINKWLVDSGARVLQMTGNIAPQSLRNTPKEVLQQGDFLPSDVLLVLLYDKPMSN